MNDSSNNIFLSDGKLGDSLKHGSLFSGIGGFDLAAEWMGWENVFHCEMNEFGRKVLSYYWPKAKSYEDITKTDFTIWRGKVDILTGGFPCQPYSVAGKRKGKEDERHLWPEMLRVIREIEPSYVVGENVFGLVNWNDGLVFHEVQADLENAGYEIQPYILPAASVNAPHKRDRVWFVAKYTKCKPNGRNRPEKSEGDGMDLERNELVQKGRKQSSNDIKPSSENAAKSTCERCNNRSDNREERQVYNNENGNAKKDKSKGNGWKCRACKIGQVGNAANSESKSSRREHEQRQRKGEFRRQDCIYFRTGWENFPTQTAICDGDDGLSAQLDTITFPKWRNESIKAGGNAIVPQVAFRIFKSIEAWEEKNIITGDMDEPIQKTGT